MQDPNNQQHDIEVELTALPASQGTIELRSGTTYPYFSIDGHTGFAQFFLADREILAPGETTRGFVDITTSPHYLVVKLSPGQSFLVVMPGGRPIAQGRILSLLYLERHAFEAFKKARAEGKDPRKPYDIEAEITFFPVAEGGKAFTIPPKFDSPPIVFEGWKRELNATIVLKDREMLQPGETTHAYVTFLMVGSKRPLLEWLRPDQPFHLKRGNKIIGNGRVLSIYPLDF